MRVRTGRRRPTGAVTLDGRASLASGPWKSNVTGWQWQQVDASDNVLAPETVTLVGADTSTPSFTAPSSAGDVYLRLTVTGRGVGASTGTSNVIYQGSDTVTITVQVVTDAATDAELAGLTLAAPDGSPVPLRDAGSLAETAFAAATAGYKAVLPAAAASVTVAPTLRSAGGAAVITPADADANAGNGHQVAVAPGRTQSISVTVTAADGATVKTWTVEAQRSAAPPTDVCARTPAVLDAIVTAVTAVTDCAAVTAAHLAGIAGSLDLNDKSIDSLKAGDFTGLIRLTGLRLDGNSLASLPAGLFDATTLLTSLRLDGNVLSSLPAGLFEPLTVLSDLRLSGNLGSSGFLPVVEAGPDLRVETGAAFALSGAPNAASPWGENVTWEWSQTGGTDTALSDTARPDPTATAPAMAGDLFFQLKATGRGGSFESFDTVRVRVHSPGAEAALASLTLTQGDGSAVRFLPGFYSTTETYLAPVARENGTVTVAAAATDPAASVAITPATDADTSAPGHQVRIPAGGEAAIMVTVTSGNGETARTYTVTATRAPTGICDRTPQVRDAILAKLSGVTDCAAVTAAHLAGITGTLNLSDKSIASLKAGDFAGLTGLTGLSLSGNELTELPTGLFDGLTNVIELLLYGNELTGLPAGLFDGLTNMARLFLDDNSLTNLPPGIFEGLSNLTHLDISDNELAGLPDGILEPLNRLAIIYLDSIPGARISCRRRMRVRTGRRRRRRR